MGYEKISQKLIFYKAFFSPQWKFLIHTILQCLSSKTTAWNEFSSTMASAIICLATSQKFNFLKFIFDSMVRNLDNLSGKFLMYPRYIRRVGKGFSGRVTPLFPTMAIQNQQELGEGSPSGPTDIVVDEAVHKELGDSLVRAATTASSLEAKQDSGGGPRCQETMGDTIAQTRFENVSKHSNDSLLARGNTLQSDEDSLKLTELMELCTNLQQRVLDLEKTKTTQAIKIDSFKRRVKKLEKRKDLGEDASKQGRRINAINADVEITLVSVQDDADAEMFDVGTVTGDEHKDLKSKDFDSIKELFDKAFKRVNMFVDFRTDLVEGSSKRAEDELEQESTKKQKVDENKETAELKELMEIIPDEEEVTIDVIPLAIKPPTIVDWKIHKE
ncbi:hypothetical protein Tco_1384046 [Tanacetum coccineum]